MDKARGTSDVSNNPGIKYTNPNITAKRVDDRASRAESTAGRDIPDPENNGPFSIYPKSPMKDEKSKGAN